jgi:hypothetical protein
MSPSSTVITMMTPNQMGSKPSVLMTGKMIGTREDDHRHGVHQAAQHQIDQHDEGQHAVASDAESGQGPAQAPSCKYELAEMP